MWMGFFRSSPVSTGAVSTNSPSGENVSAVKFFPVMATGIACLSLPDVVSHTRTPSPPMATSLPSGENAVVLALPARPASALTSCEAYGSNTSPGLASRRIVTVPSGLAVAT
jgi:hypothetical protein